MSLRVSLRIAIVLLPALLACLGWLSVARYVSARGSDLDTAPAKWVRTKDGWERATWLKEPPAYSVPVHPWVVSVFLGTAGVLALLAGGEQALSKRARASLLIGTGDRI